MDAINGLQQCGLSIKEAKVYLACLELGRGTALKIGLKAGLPKSTTHDILRELNKKSFVSAYQKSNRKYFTAADPDILEERAKRQAVAAAGLLPQLKARMNVKPDKPTVRFYEDKHGLDIVLKEIATETKDLLVLSSINEAYETLPEYFPRAIAERIKNHVFAKRLYKNSGGAPSHKQNDQKEFAKTRLIKPAIDFTSTAWLWKDKVVFFNTAGNFSVLIIEDREIAKLLRSMFESMWEHEPER